jgi:glutamate-ammonia-ligase adenylyltransferase
VERTLKAIEDNWPDDAPPFAETISNFPLGAEALFHLLSVSSICGARLVQQPEILLWLARPEICADRRGYGRMLTGLHNLAGKESIAAENFRILRLWKGREMVRIALREVADAAPLDETIIELSQLADICLTKVYEHWDRELRQRWGSPTSKFAIIGVGKLGGRELNHSSDVDLIFVYSDEGQLTAQFSYHEWFTRLGNKIIETFATSDPAGSLFRVDLRLRPEGSAGPLVRSLESMENYYAGFGEIWERLALIKARWICGDRELAYDFLRQLQPFIFPKSPTPDLLDDVASIKAGSSAILLGTRSENETSSLVREVSGKSNSSSRRSSCCMRLDTLFCRNRGTLRTIRGLAELELLPNEDAHRLEAAYCFLRRVEHRLQIEAEQQTHTVPEEGEALEVLARSLGFADGAGLLVELRKQMGAVRTIFKRVVSGPAPGQEAGVLDFRNFRDKAQATKTVAQLGESAAGFHVAPRTRQIFRKLRPLLLKALAGTADPDNTLTQFVRFVEAYGLRSLLFELLAANPRLLDLLVRTLDTSEVAGGWLIRRPQLLEELTRSGLLDRTFNVSQHLERLESLGATAADLDPVRIYRKRELLRILLRDVLELAPLPRLLAEQNDVAEACLVFVDRLLNPIQSLTIVAMGKFGGREIGYGADLDVLFVGEDQRSAQLLTGALAQPSAEGTFTPLDARLRPDGEKGPLVCSLETLRNYYETRAQFWELQALTARALSPGRWAFEFEALAKELWREAGTRRDLVRQIEDMLVRIANERGCGNDFFDFKTGIGGMIEAEFLVQALQMQHRVWEPNFSSAIEKLATRKIFAHEDARSLQKAYYFLRVCESVLRRWQNRSVSTLPTSREEEDQFARRMRFKTIDDFRAPYSRAREVIHSLRQRYLAE